MTRVRFGAPAFVSLRLSLLASETERRVLEAAGTETWRLRSGPDRGSHHHWSGAGGGRQGRGLLSAAGRACLSGYIVTVFSSVHEIGLVSWPRSSFNKSLVMPAEACPELSRRAAIQKSSRFPRKWTSGKASGRSRWIFASMATLPTPFAAYSKGPGLTELLRFYVCGLQPRPSVQL